MRSGSWSDLGRQGRETYPLRQLSAHYIAVILHRGDDDEDFERACNLSPLRSYY